MSSAEKNPEISENPCLLEIVDPASGSGNILSEANKKAYSILGEGIMDEQQRNYLKNLFLQFQEAEEKIEKTVHFKKKKTTKETEKEKAILRLKRKEFCTKKIFNEMIYLYHTDRGVIDEDYENTTTILSQWIRNKDARIREILYSGLERIFENMEKSTDLLMRLEVLRIIKGKN